MQKSDSKQKAMNAQRKVSSSTTLNRRYVKRPVMNSDTEVHVNRNPQVVTRFDENVVPLTTTSTRIQTREQAKKIASDNVDVSVHPVQASANQYLRARKAQMMNTTKTNQASARQLKEQAIQKALAETIATDETKAAPKKKKKELSKLRFGFGRVVLALSCAAIAVFAIVYYVNVNMPDLSLKVAAMQTGINATYPSYVPRDFSLASITSENKKITLIFKNHATNESYSIVEETSSWDSNALLNNYVAPTYGDEYSAIREQGLTIFTSNNETAWVNGGVIYKLKTDSAKLTGKQIRAIAASL